MPAPPGSRLFSASGPSSPRPGDRVWIGANTGATRDYNYWSDRTGTVIRQSYLSLCWWVRLDEEVLPTVSRTPTRELEVSQEYMYKLPVPSTAQFAGELPWHLREE